MSLSPAMRLSTTGSMHRNRVNRLLLPFVVFVVAFDHLLAIFRLQLGTKFITWSLYEWQQIINNEQLTNRFVTTWLHMASDYSGSGPLYPKQNKSMGGGEAPDLAACM
jgi:hypothetical protein